MKKLLVPALVVLSLSLPLSAYAAPGNRPMGPGPQLESLFRQLELTPEQKGKLETIRAAQANAAKPVLAQLRAKQGEMFTIMKSVNGTKDQAIAKHREVQALQNQLGEMRISSWFEARKVLSPDQLKKLESLKLPQMRQRKMRRTR